jgi:hypothetical protein
MGVTATSVTERLLRFPLEQVGPDVVRGHVKDLKRPAQSFMPVAERGSVN